MQPENQNAVDINFLKTWIGNSEQHHDIIAHQKVAALAASLNQTAPAAGAPLPMLWHWMYFWSIAAQSELGEDGHPKRGGFMPPVPLPRRMWAGGRLRFHAALPIGCEATRTSRIVSVEAKNGKSGSLAFVTVEHAIAANDEVAIIEEHDIVYRDFPAVGAVAPSPPAAPANALWNKVITPDPVLLFRYSALTFNGHRIHYDRSYATEVEGYPGLIVHGPLIASLLVGLLMEKMPAAQLASFSFKAISPLFDIDPFTVCGQPADDGLTIDLWAKNSQGALAMQAKAILKK